MSQSIVPSSPTNGRTGQPDDIWSNGVGRNVGHGVGSGALAPVGPQTGGALGMPMQSQNAGGGPPLKKIHRVLRGRYGVALGLGMLGALAGGVWGWFSSAPEYKATGSITIDPVIKDIDSADRVIPLYQSFMKTKAAELNGPDTVKDAMSSAPWRDDGGAKLDGDKDHNERLVDGFIRNLSVNYDQNSYNIYFTYNHEDPKLARAGVEAMLAAAADNWERTGINDTENTIVATNSAINTNLNARSGLQRQIDRLTNEFGTTNLDIRETQLNNELDKLNTDIRNLRVATRLADDALSRESTATTQDLAKNDETLRTLLAERRAADRQMANTRQRFGAKHPQVTQAQQFLDQLDQDIEAYAETLRTDTAAMPNPGGGIFGSEEAIIMVDRNMLDALETQLRLKEEMRAEFQTEQQKLVTASAEVERLERQRDGLDREGERLTARMNELQSNRALQGQNFRASGVGPASVDADKRSRMALVGAVGGASVPIGIVLLMGLLDTRYRYSDDAAAEQMSGLTLLGILPNLPDRLSDPEQASIAAHCVHQIRTMLQLGARTDDPLSYCMTSATSGDGKTSLTLAMGLSFAASGSRTLMIDTDLVGQGLSDRLGIRGEDSPQGLLDSLRDVESYDQFVHPTDVADLALLPVGAAEGGHAGGISPQAMRRLIAKAKHDYDIVLVDTGPILGSIEATPVAAAVDGVILAVSRGQDRQFVDRALAHLNSIGAKVAGVVFNRAQNDDFEKSINGMSMKSVARSTPANGRITGGVAGALTGQTN
ncbi:MAG: AAA family ATPase [Planctomycetota bacterium]